MDRVDSAAIALVLFALYKMVSVNKEEGLPLNQFHLVRNIIREERS